MDLIDYDSDHDPTDNCSLEEDVPVTRFEVVEDKITKKCRNCTYLVGLLNELYEKNSILKDKLYWEDRISRSSWRALQKLYEAYEVIYYKIDPQSRPMKFNVDFHLRH